MCGKQVKYCYSLIVYTLFTCVKRPNPTFNVYKTSLNQMSSKVNHTNCTTLANTDTFTLVEVVHVNCSINQTT